MSLFFYLHRKIAFEITLRILNESDNPIPLRDFFDLIEQEGSSVRNFRRIRDDLTGFNLIEIGKIEGNGKWISLTDLGKEAVREIIRAARAVNKPMGTSIYGGDIYATDTYKSFYDQGFTLFLVGGDEWMLQGCCQKLMDCVAEFRFGE